MPRNALGRGLGALIREPEAPVPATSASSFAPAATTGVAPAPIADAGAGVSSAQRQLRALGAEEVDVDLIEPSPYQPRTTFREEALDELARSIQASGIIQPLVLRAHRDRFQLIAGERRWRAAQKAGSDQSIVDYRGRAGRIRA